MPVPIPAIVALIGSAAAVAPHASQSSTASVQASKEMLENRQKKADARAKLLG